jgi:hypothetical protein
MTTEERSAFYRWEFKKWQNLGVDACDCGGTAIKTHNRAEWLCSGCARDVSIFVVLLAKALQ